MVITEIICAIIYEKDGHMFPQTYDQMRKKDEMAVYNKHLLSRKPVPALNH